ncbi:MAG: hypothetical protein LW809_01325 [Vampirovibrionales bacterium]|jgi:hypothetical protein|nr:hypothetical protein [Vampirovibrionales bacterium]
MSGIVSFAMVQRNTSLLYDYRWQQQLLSQAQQNLVQTSFALNAVGQDLESGSTYYTLFQQQLAAINQLEKQIALQMAQLQQNIEILEKDSEGQQKIVDKWREKAFSYFA